MMHGVADIWESQNWASVPDWFAAIGTVGALVATLLLFASDRKRRRREQAVDGYELDLPIEEGARLLVVAFEDSMGQSCAWDVKKKRMLSSRRRVRLRMHTSKLFASASTSTAGSPPVR